MTDENNGNANEGRPDLRPIFTRLVDLQRKCRSLGSKNDEAASVEERIESILGRLDASNDPESEPVSYTALARELFSVERFFESIGFMSVAKEVTHIEKALIALDPEDADDQPVERAVALPLTTDRSTEPDAGAEPEEIEEPVSRWKMPMPVAATLGLFVAAVVACLVIIFGQGRTPPEPVTPPVVQPTAVPTEAPVPTATPPPPDPNATPAPGARLAEEIGKARIALAQGDVDTAIHHISLAALVDADHTMVLEAADQVVDLLVQRSNHAAAMGEWEAADEALSRALRVAGRFGFDTERIDEAAKRQSELERFRLLQPGDTDAIRAAAGERVTVHRKDGSTQEAIIKDVRGGVLLLTEDTVMRGGTVYYVDKIPLSEIVHLQVWED
jgi:hypothetical protein